MRAAILLLALAGCGPSIVSATPRSVTLNRVNQMTVEEATGKAQAHCAQYGRDAELVPDAHQDGIATFKCVDDQDEIDAQRTARAKREAELAELRASKTAVASTATLRGFYCAASASAGFCAREKADCVTARDAALAAVPEIGECVLVETAHCFDADGRERCFPIAELCAARANGAACVERK